MSNGISTATSARPRLGCSACLVGQSVRYDGAHKRNRALHEFLAPKLELVPVCPEVELGLGTPRAPIRLEQTEAGDLRLFEPAGAVDWTAAMQTFAAQRCRELNALGLDGFLLKSSSPSCGLQRLPVFNTQGHELHRTGTGLFAAALRLHLPDLPLLEEDLLELESEREAFLTRIFARFDLRRNLQRR